MANRHGAGRGRKGPGGGSARREGGLSVRQVGEGQFELVHPRCVEERSEDYEEAMEAWREGEVQEAEEMLRYALEGCSDNVWIHSALGRIALEGAGNVDLARGHFGYAFDLIQRALPDRFQGRLPGELAANSPVYQAIEGLIACALIEGDQRQVEELQKLQSGFRG